jgi:hypothetical protein
METYIRSEAMVREVLAIIGFCAVETVFAIGLFRALDIFIGSNPSNLLCGMMSFICAIGVPSITLALLFLMKKAGNINGIL